MKFLFSALLSFCFLSSAVAGELDDKGIYNISYENDVFSGTDQNYTNGVRISYLTAENDIPRIVLDWAAKAPFFHRAGKRRASFAVGQSMFTPQDITISQLQPNNRPYAGWLYGSAGLVSDSGDRLDNLQLTVGVVGPASLAEQTQKFVHKNMNGSPDPKGWRHQLKNEPGIILSYERQWKTFYEINEKHTGWAFDFSPHLGASVGNVFTYAAAGGTFRLGYDLPNDYGPPRIRPSLPGSDYFVPTDDLGWYLFAGFEGRAVGRNIFLDGNTLTDSHSVDREAFTGDIQTGLAVILYGTRVAYTHIFRGKEFQQQGRNDQFGALTVSVRY